MWVEGLTDAIMVTVAALLLAKCD